MLRRKEIGCPCEGNDEIIIMGNADTGKMRLIAEIDKKGRIARRGGFALMVSP